MSFEHELYRLLCVVTTPAGAITLAARTSAPDVQERVWVGDKRRPERRFPVSAAEDEAKGALVRLKEHYLNHPVRGGWYDQFDAQGKSLVDFIPASSFYHIVCAISEAEQVLS